MRALGVARLVVAMAVIGGTACSIWAAISDPYKSDGVAGGDGGGAADAALRDAAARRVDAGILTPYAIAVYGDSVYVVGANGEVQVERGSSATFVSFWAADGGEFFYPREQGVSVSDAGVFWTVSTGIHFCALDGGACGFLSSPPPNIPKAIAASDTAVVWVDSKGVEECKIPLDTCVPWMLPGSKSATLVTAGAVSTAWMDTTTTIHWNGASIPLGAHVVTAVEIDRTSGNLYWGGPYELGSVSADAAAGPVWPLGDQAGRVEELFSANGVVYWSISGVSDPFYCRVDSDAGCLASPLHSGLSGANANYGIAANARNVFAIIASTTNSPREPVLFEWPVPH